MTGVTPRTAPTSTAEYETRTDTRGAGRAGRGPEDTGGNQVAETHRHASRRRWTRLTASIAAISIVTFAFATAGGASAPDRVRHAKGPSGEITFGLEAETTNYCLSRAQLAISGIQVVAAVYDTLTVPNDKGVAVPVPREVGHTQRRLHRVDDRAAPEHQVPERRAARRQRGEAQPRQPTAAPRARPSRVRCSAIILKFISDVQVVDPLDGEGHDEHPGRRLPELPLLPRAASGSWRRSRSTRAKPARRR